VRRRDVIWTLLGGGLVATLPFLVHAQQPMPTVSVVSPASSATSRHRMSRPTAAALILLAILAAAAPTVGAEAPAKVYRAAVLATNPLPGGQSFPPPALAELARHGFVEGRNLKLDSYFGPPERLADLARELVATHPDVILAGGPPAARAIHGLLKLSLSSRSPVFWSRMDLSRALPAREAM
jgi:hypothetical protein